MADGTSAHVKYVFMDIVGYTKDRSIEAQIDIVHKLNEIVRESLVALKIDHEKTRLVPTGDGICIALVEVMHPFDIHVSLALEILRRIAEYNAAIPQQERKFEVRIGLNENVDNIITDINRQRSVAGAGINMAQRIMSNGDGGHLLISQSVFWPLEPREKYRGLFREYEFETKHNERHKLYQYIGKNERRVKKQPPSTDKLKEVKETLHPTIAYARALREHVEGAPAIELSTDAKELLLAASKDPKGEIFHAEYIVGFQIGTNGRAFVQQGNPRSEAHWRAVLKELIDLRLITNGSQICRVTNLGFAESDKYAGK